VTRPSFPTVIDSSLIAAFRACPTQAFYNYFQHWKPRGVSVHLHAGKAFAAGSEATRLAYYLGRYKRREPDGTWSFHDRATGLEQESIACGLAVLLAEYGDFECPPDSAKSAERMAGAFMYFFDAFRLTEDRAVPVSLAGGQRGIEVSFTQPVDFAHPETGDPLLFTGRLDMLTEYAGQMFGEDDKTTSQLGASWARQWELRSQFISYSWGVRSLGYDLAGFLVRGVSILKTKYDHAQAICYYPPWMVDEWYEQLVTRDLPLMKFMWERESWGRDLSEACNAYGGCSFKSICMSDPKARQAWLEGSFERRKWDPVTRTEIRL